MVLYCPKSEKPTSTASDILASIALDSPAMSVYGYFSKIVYFIRQAKILGQIALKNSRTPFLSEGPQGLNFLKALFNYISCFMFIAYVVANKTVYSKVK